MYIPLYRIMRLRGSTSRANERVEARDEEEVPPPPPPPGLPPAQTQLDALVQAITAIAHQARPARATVSLKEFLHYKPLFFKGTSNPRQAELWVDSIEKIFDMLGEKISETEKVQYATFMFEGEAAHWWRATKGQFPEQPRMVWTQFRHIFFEHYLPVSHKFDMEKEFIDLKQRDMPVLEYVDEFVRLSRYAPHIIENEEAKARRLISGLDTPIQQYVGPMGLTTFRRAVEVAEDWEKLHPEHKHKSTKANTTSGKRAAVDVTGPNKRANKPRVYHDKNVVPNTPCPNYGGKHWRVHCPLN